MNVKRRSDKWQWHWNLATKIPSIPTKWITLWALEYHVVNVALDACKDAWQVECYIQPNVIHYAEKINEKSLENSDFFGWFLFQFCNSTRTKRAQSKKVTLFQLLSTYNHCDTIKRKKMAHNLHNQFFLANNLGIIVTTNINPSVTFAAIKVSGDT